MTPYIHIATEQQREWTTRTRRPIYHITIQTKTRDGEGIGQRMREAIIGHRESKDARTSRQHSKRVHSAEAHQNWSEIAPIQTLHKQPGPLTITATNTTDTEVDRAIDEAKCEKNFQSETKTVRSLLIITPIRIL